MAKIYRYRISQNNCIKALRDLLQKAENGEMTGFIFAANLPDGNVATSWVNVDVGDRQHLISHMQVDLNFAIVEVNADHLANIIGGYLE